MGLLNLFRRRPSAAPVEPAAPAAPAAAPAGPLPAPGPGRIVSFSLVDEVGAIALPGGETLRFGRSACRGFEPVADLPVIVEAVAAHPLGGGRATAVSLPEAERPQYESLLSARDAAAGFAPQPTFATADTAHQLGWITILLREPLPPRGAALSAMLTPLGLEALGFRLRSEPALEIEDGRRTLQLFLGEEPFSAKYMDLRAAPEGLDPGRGFLAISAGLPGFEQSNRLMLLSSYPDPWAPDGTLRRLSQLAAALLPLGEAVVLNQGGGLVCDRETFLRRLGSLSDPACRPFGAWLDLAKTDDGAALRTYGMPVLGLPEVYAPTEGCLFDWHFDRRLEAVLFAGYVMTRENRVLKGGERLAVPVGALDRIGAWPLPEREGPTLAYEVREGEAGLHLQPLSPLPDPS